MQVALAHRYPPLCSLILLCFSQYTVDVVLVELTRSNRVVKLSDMMTANANVAKVLGSIQA